MKFSEYWLRNWVNPNINTDELCDQLTMAGLEVDGCEAVAGEFTGVVIGKVVECQQHPNADKLRVTKVDVGQSELLNIVCGAPNCRQGLMVACATVGAVLPGDFKIKPAKLRGEPSEGMLCSYSELGISSDEDGIIELPADAPIGMNVREFLKLDDHAIEISITPNRGDCFSIMGVARDISAINNLPINLPEIVPVQATLNDTISITLAEPEAAPKYLGRIIKGVNVKAETPIWMKEQLRRGGIRSIDPIVDVTNYVLLELGHPMHAFDLNKIEGGITVRYGRPNEKITLLDGNEVTIKDKTVVISDDKKALALGGIFGGADSGVTTDTQDILLEAAYFNPVAIAGKAREYGLHTESSHRYERGVDPELQHRAMERATALILEICGGAAGNIIESVNEAWLPKAKVITLRREKLDSLIGYVIESNLVSDILTKLGFKVESQGENWSVTIPSWRFDCAIEADLVEEVARIYGYNRIPNQTLLAGLTMKPNSEKVMSVNRLKLLLVDQGYQEAITYSFVDPKTQALLHPSKPFMQLPNPISSEMSAMRLSLWTGLIDAVLYNQNRQQSRVKLFETGLRFIPDASSEFEIRQESVLSGVVTGNRDDENWAIKEAKFDFFDLKGEIEVLLSHIKGTHQLTYQRSSNPALHPGQSAEVLIDGRCVGEFGVLHPEIQKKLDLNSTTLVFELSLEGICQKSLPQAKDLSKFPSNRRDIAVVVDNDVAVADLLNVIKTEAGDTLVKVTVFDLYQGDNIRAGAKSLALSLILQNKERTLDDQEITDIVSKCVLALKNQFNAQLR